MDMDVDILEVDADSIKIELADAEATDATAHPLPPRSTSTWPTAFTEKLWDHQQEAVKAFWSSLSGGVKRMGFSLPTGAGKTAIFSTITMQMVKNGRQRGRSARVLILVSSGELGRQAKESLENMDRNEARKVSIGWEQGQERASLSAEVIIATYQTLQNDSRRRNFRNKFNGLKEFELVVVDEAHHAAANSYLRILSDFNDDIDIARCTSTPAYQAPDFGLQIPIIGFSATLIRADNRALSSVFEIVAYEVSIDDPRLAHRLAPLTQCNWLAEQASESPRGLNGELRKWLVPPPISRIRPQIDPSQDELKMDIAELEQLANTSSFNSAILGRYQTHAEDRRSTLIFMSSIDHVQSVAKAFIAAGISTRAVTMNTPAHEVRDALESFRQGKLPVLINCMMLMEGYDAPQTDCIIMAKPTKSRIAYAQMMGRGTRKCENPKKTDCLVVDLVGNCVRFPHWGVQACLD